VTIRIPVPSVEPPFRLSSPLVWTTGKLVNCVLVDLLLIGIA
jgi:hypothetical protein